MAVYAPGDQWSDRMPAAFFLNGTVVDVAEDLEKILAGRSR
jgi:hypothetical protein